MADRSGGDPRAPRAFHRRLPGYAPTPLISVPLLARELGVARILVKVEAERLGLPSFKILGASWATYRALEERLGSLEPWSTLEDLRGRLAVTGIELVAATDGNHGRAVARMAGLLGLRGTILVPSGTAAARIEGIRREGAVVNVVDGTYDEAVVRSADYAATDPARLLMSDTSWPGYERIPGWVIDGYATIFDEVDEALAGGAGGTGDTGGADDAGVVGAVLDASGGAGDACDVVVDIAVVPVGVGALAAAAVRALRWPARPHPVRILGVEPLDAACALETIRAGHPVVVPGPHRSIMAGLNCGEVSLLALPDLLDGMTVMAAIDDAPVLHAMRDLASAGIVAGECGAGTLAGLRAAAANPAARAALGLGPDATVLLVSTEGITDPETYARALALVD